MEFRYFASIDPVWEKRAKAAQNILREQYEKEQNLKDEHAAFAVYMRGKKVAGIALEEKVDRVGWIFSERIPSDDPAKTFFGYKPDRRTKVGKVAAEKILDLNKGRKSFSDLMLGHLSFAFRNSWVAEDRVMSFPVSGFMKDRVVFKIPLGKESRYEPIPEGLEELKKSEFIALTEE